MIEETSGNENTSSICVSNTDGLDRWIWKIGACLLPLVGLPGHLMMIMTILHCKSRRAHPTFLYFISMSIVESIHLSFMFWDWLAVVRLVIDPRRILGCAFFYSFVHGTGYISLLLLAQLNIDRISMLHQPKQAHLARTYRHVLVRIFLTSSSFLLFVIHYRLSIYYDSNIISDQVCQIYSRARRWFHFAWPYFHLFCRLIPCVIFVFCSGWICCNRYRYRRIDRKMIGLHRQKQQRRFSLVLVLFSIYTFFAVISISVLQIFSRSVWKYDTPCVHAEQTDRSNNAERWKLLHALFILWETSIYTSKFYVKFCFSAEFRRDAKATACCRTIPDEPRKPSRIAYRTSVFI